MEDKKEKMVSMPKEQYDAIMRELFEGIIRENHDHPPVAKRIKCNDCIHKEPWTSNCKTVNCKYYPNGIPKEICTEEEICEEFKRK